MSLILNLRKVLSSGEPFAFKEQMELDSLFADRDDVSVPEPAQVNLKAEEVAGITTVQGTCTATIHYVCSRCLTRFESHTVFEIDEAFSRDQGLIEEADQEDQIHPVESDQVDLVPYIHENVLLAIPFVPLCDEDCKGLCPECGVNLNEQACSCNTESIDPRLADLKLFFEDR